MILAVISLVAWAVSWARSLTSVATTAKPLPACPARAASMRRVQRQQVRLLGDVGDQLDDVADLPARLAEPRHRRRRSGPRSSSPRSSSIAARRSAGRSPGSTRTAARSRPSCRSPSRRRAAAAAVRAARLRRRLLGRPVQLAGQPSAARRWPRSAADPVGGGRHGGPGSRSAPRSARRPSRPARRRVDHRRADGQVPLGQRPQAASIRRSGRRTARTVSSAGGRGEQGAPASAASRMNRAARGGRLGAALRWPPAPRRASRRRSRPAPPPARRSRLAGSRQLRRRGGVVGGRGATMLVGGLRVRDHVPAGRRVVGRAASPGATAAAASYFVQHASRACSVDLVDAVRGRAAPRWSRTARAITSARSASCIMSAFHWSLMPSLTVAISRVAAAWSAELRTREDRSPARPTTSAGRGHQDHRRATMVTPRRGKRTPRLTASATWTVGLGCGDHDGRATPSAGLPSPPRTAATAAPRSSATGPGCCTRPAFRRLAAKTQVHTAGSATTSCVPG